MTGRSRLAAPGGFVPLAAVASRVDDLDPCCTFCFRFDERAWLHVSTQRLVCSRCMGDPWADDGNAGTRTAERLIALLEEEASPVVY
jgi:hypothetical protein